MSNPTDLDDATLELWLESLGPPAGAAPRAGVAGILAAAATVKAAPAAAATGLAGWKLAAVLALATGAGFGGGALRQPEVQRVEVPVEVRVEVPAQADLQVGWTPPLAFAPADVAPPVLVTRAIYIESECAPVEPPTLLARDDDSWVPEPEAYAASWPEAEPPRDAPAPSSPSEVPDDLLASAHTAPPAAPDAGRTSLRFGIGPGLSFPLQGPPAVPNLNSQVAIAHTGATPRRAAPFVAAGFGLSGGSSPPSRSGALLAGGDVRGGLSLRWAKAGLELGWAASGGAAARWSGPRDELRRGGAQPWFGTGPAVSLRLGRDGGHAFLASLTAQAQVRPDEDQQALWEPWIGLTLGGDFVLPTPGSS